MAAHLRDKMEALAPKLKANCIIDETADTFHLEEAVLTDAQMKK